MQIDWHLGAVTFLAEAAGWHPLDAANIGLASQFVDENVEDLLLDGPGVHAVALRATAHHGFDLVNADKEDQRSIWTPFHFLPGGEGTGASQRLICVKGNSPVALAMLKFCAELFQESRKRSPWSHPWEDHYRGVSEPTPPGGTFILGIAMHAYADTWAHQGFSGIESPWNDVRDLIVVGPHKPHKEDIRVYATEFKKKHGKETRSPYFKGVIENMMRSHRGFRSALSSMAESVSGSLGHGGALSFPDWPYMRWAYVRERDGAEVVRDNPADYLEAAEHIHAFLTTLSMHPERAVPWDKIKDDVQRIIHVSDDKRGRLGRWSGLAANRQSESVLPWLTRSVGGPNWFKSYLGGENQLVNWKKSFARSAEAYRTEMLGTIIPEKAGVNVL